MIPLDKYLFNFYHVIQIVAQATNNNTNYGCLIYLNQPGTKNDDENTTYWHGCMPYGGTRPRIDDDAL